MISDNGGEDRHSLNWNKIIGDITLELPAPDYNDLLATIERLKRRGMRRWLMKKRRRISP